MSIRCIARLSILIFFFCSNLFADTFRIPASYDHCFLSPYYKDDNPPHEAALAIGECFYLAAENILLDDYENEQDEASPGTTNIVSALQYADSWFRLAIHKGSTVAITFLHHTELYLLEAQQKHPLQNLRPLSISKDAHATTH